MRWLAVSLLLLSTAGWCQEQDDGSTGLAQIQSPEGDARAREDGAEEDPLTAQQEQTKQESEMSVEGAWSDDPNDFEVYGSLRVRYRGTSGKYGFDDGGSRVGVTGRWQILPRRWLFARGEAGFNLLEELGALTGSPGGTASNPDPGRGDTFFRRLLNVGYESPNLFLVVGKTWSTYYKVSGFTDRFAGTGGKASGTYNAGTDGGRTGTGRAESALQTRLLVDFLPKRWGIEPFNLNIQLQDGQPIPNLQGERYGLGLGLSAVLATRANFSLGLAYNRAEVSDPKRAALRQQGLRGDAEALVIGTRWFADDWYLATVLARLRNHETTDQDIYFDGWGAEFYAQRRLRNRWWVTGGFNWLEPESGQVRAGDYRVRFGVLGIRYSIKDFQRYIYANIRLEDSRNQDGELVDDVFTAGIRWAFSAF